MNPIVFCRTCERVEILTLCRRAWDVKIVGVTETRNGVTDMLAKHALAVGVGDVQFDDVLAHIADIVSQKKQARCFLFYQREAMCYGMSFVLPL